MNAMDCGHVVQHERSRLHMRKEITVLAQVIQTISNLYVEKAPYPGSEFPHRKQIYAVQQRNFCTIL